MLQYPAPRNLLLPLFLGACLWASGPARTAAAEKPVNQPAPPPVGQRFQTTENGLILDTKTGRTWQRAVSPQKLAWSGAKKYCASLPLPGTNWRVPTLKEIQEIFSSDARSTIRHIFTGGELQNELWTASGGKEYDGSPYQSVIQPIVGASSRSAPSSLHMTLCVR